MLLANLCFKFFFWLSSGEDAYDLLLTKEEIQSVITKINLLMALEQVESCVKNFDLHNLQFALLSRHIGLKSAVKAAKLEAYCRRLSELLSQSPDAYLTPADIESCVAKVNKQVRYLFLRCLQASKFIPYAA